MNNFRNRRQDFAVRGVAWRRGLDWAIENIPFWLHPFLIFFWTSLIRFMQFSG
jgi:hypothetical protein